MFPFEDAIILQCLVLNGSPVYAILDDNNNNISFVTYIIIIDKQTNNIASNRGYWLGHVMYEQ